jgi:hypothetical protein
MGYEDIQKNIETEEGLSAGEAKVRQILGELKRVETPKSFGFAVQARIANARPEDFRTAGSGLSFLRYAVPLALVLMVVSGFVLNGIYNVNDNSVPAVAGSNLTPPFVTVGPVEPASQSELASTGNDPQSNTGFERRVTPGTEVLAAIPPTPRTKKATVSSKDSGGGSYVTTQGGPAAIIDLDPKGPVTSAPLQPGQIGPAGQIPVQAILKIVGIKADSSNEGWKVTAVEANSLSDHSGVKAGDYVEAINGQPVTEGTRFSGGLVVKNLRIKRDGKSLDIPLK